MAIEEISSELDRTVLFGGLDKDELRRLASISRETSLDPGDILFEQGDESDGLYIVVSGIVRIFLTSEDTREATIKLLEDGEVIGEIALLDGLPRSAGAAALTAAKLIFVPRTPFLDMLEATPKLAQQIILMLCERLRDANTQVDQAIFHDLRYRLLELLHQLAMIHGRIEEEMAIVDMELSQGMLAQMLGSSREAVNKQLRTLAKEGRIRMNGRHIELLRKARA